MFCDKTYNYCRCNFVIKIKHIFILIITILSFFTSADKLPVLKQKL